MFGPSKSVSVSKLRLRKMVVGICAILSSYCSFSPFFPMSTPCPVLWSIKVHAATDRQTILLFSKKIDGAFREKMQKKLFRIPRFFQTSYPAALIYFRYFSRSSFQSQRCQPNTCLHEIFQITLWLTFPDLWRDDFDLWSISFHMISFQTYYGALILCRDSASEAAQSTSVYECRIKNEHGEIVASYGQVGDRWSLISWVWKYRISLAKMVPNLQIVTDLWSLDLKTDWRSF